MSVSNDNLYTMTDEDFLSADPSALFAAAEALERASSVSDEQDDQPYHDSQEHAESDAQDVSEPETLDAEELIDEYDSTGSSEPEEEEELDEAEDHLDDPEQDEDEAELEGDEESEEDDSAEDDSELVQTTTQTNKDLEAILAPLNHKGTEFKPKDVEEVRRLMSMGLDYSRKMQGMKEQRKLLKMLDNNQLLDESKLTFAIDLIKGDKDAIAQLVRDHKLDTLELEEDGKYTPSNYAVSDSEVELDDVLDSIRSTPTFADTMATIADWDESSKRELAQQPQLVSVLNEHKANGLYAMVQEQVQRERMLGGLVGLSELDAYRAVGDKLHRAGMFNAPATTGSNQQAVQPKHPAKKVVRRPKASAEEIELQEQRRKAVPPKASKAKKQPQNYDFWNMTDEEFEKFKF